METILQKKWEYTFSKDTNGRLILSVLCGTAGLFELDVVLDQHETNQYNKTGEAYIEQLAKQVRNRPGDWTSRRINL